MPGPFCLGERQISPQIIQVSVGASGSRVITLATEEVHIPRRVWQPPGGTTPGSYRVIRIIQLECVKRGGDVGTGLIDVRRTFPPDPLTAGHIEFPDVVQESCGLCGIGTVT